MKSVQLAVRPDRPEKLGGLVSLMALGKYNLKVLQ